MGDGPVPQVVQSNPVTATVAVGAILALGGYVFGWDEALQLKILQATLGAAFLVRGGVAWLEAHRRHQGPSEPPTE